ncbi:hypothetical protein KW798_00625 [Candidatus Parcubacteria bacterium]|nr:hypothetical protein [Candidatus Parcubacteria bacterium]
MLVSLLIKYGIASNEKGAIKIILGVIVVCVAVSIALLFFNSRSSASDEKKYPHVQANFQPN